MKKTEIENRIMEIEYSYMYEMDYLDEYLKNHTLWAIEYVKLCNLLEKYYF